MTDGEGRVLGFCSVHGEPGWDEGPCYWFEVTGHRFRMANPSGLCVLVPVVVVGTQLELFAA